MSTCSLLHGNPGSGRSRLRYLAQHITQLRLTDWCVFVALTVVGIAAVIHSRCYAGPVFDDAFITFRHAYNLVHGEGFTCNPGERIEGTSSPLFALLIALPVALGFDPMIAATIVGTSSFIACTMLAYAITTLCLRDRLSRWMGIGAAAMVAASPSLAFHSQTGRETLPYCFLVGLSLWFQLRVTRQPSSAAWALVAGCVALTRPEGWVLFLALWLAVIWRRSFSRVAWLATAHELVAFTAVYGPWILFRLIYFGAWTSDSAISKSGTVAHCLTLPLNVAIREILHGPASAPIVTFASRHGFALLTTAGCLLLRRLRVLALLVATLVCVHVALALWNDDEWMPHNRLFAPCLMPLAVATAAGVRGFLFHQEQRTLAGHAPSYGIWVATMAFLLHNDLKSEPEASVALTDPAKVREVGRRLAAVMRPDDVLASEQAGLLPYYWRIRTIDMFGICDAHIAGHGKPQPSGTGHSDLDYVADRRPTFYAFGDVAKAADYYSSSAFAQYREGYYLVQYPYRYLGTYGAGAPPTVFVRKDRSNVKQVAEALGVRLVDAGTELRRLGFIR